MSEKKCSCGCGCDASKTPEYRVPVAGEEMTLDYRGEMYSGRILERLTEADTGEGPWTTQLLIELHRYGLSS